MLPPVQLPADRNAAHAADLTASADLPTAPGSFGTALAALFRPQAALPKPLAPGQLLPDTGQTLPQGGKDLPVMPVITDRAPDPETTRVDFDDLAALPPGLESGGAQLVLTSNSPEVSQIRIPVPAGIALTASGDPGHSATTAAPTITAERAQLAATPPASLAPVTVLPGSREGVPRQARQAGIVLPSPDTELLTGSASATAEPAAIRPEAAETRLSQQAMGLTAPAVFLRQLTNPSANLNLQASLQIASIPADVKEQKGALTGSTVPTPVFAVAPAPVVPTVPLSGGANMPAMADISLPPGSAGWGDALGDRVVWMAGNRIHNAEIRLNPADLGPLRVQISVDDGTANINFHAHHPVTRDAIEQALPRLRDMLGDQGLSLGNTSVSDHGVSHDESHADRHGSMSQSFPTDDESTATAADTQTRSTRAAAAAGLVDMFA